MKRKMLSLVIMATLMVTLSTGCQSIQRMGKNVSSSSSGLERVMKVYSHEGELLAEYEGKFDISENESGTKVKFDLNGKRTIIYNAIVIVDEK